MMRISRRGAAAMCVLLLLLLCTGRPGAQERDEGLPPEGLPPSTFSPPLPSPTSPLQRSPAEQQRREDPEAQRLEALIEQADDGFVPISELPPEEQMPAAPMLVAAYSFVVIAIFGYLLSLSRRLGAVTQEIARLEVATKRNGRA
jgi:CcmD family protein